MPPNYIYSLLVAQQQQHPTNETSFQNNQFDVHNKPAQKTVISPTPLPTQPAQQLTNNKHMFSIENLFTPSSKEDIPEISKPTIIKMNLTNETTKCCDHKEELYLLRQNVYKMLYKNLPSVLLAFNLLNDPLSPQIDCILQSLLVYNQENSDRFNNCKELEIKNFFNQYSFNRTLFSTTT